MPLCRWAGMNSRIICDYTRIKALFMPTSHYVKVNNLHLRYLDYSNRLAPTVVFYHATGFTSELW